MRLALVWLRTMGESCSRVMLRSVGNRWRARLGMVAAFRAVFGGESCSRVMLRSVGNRWRAGLGVVTVFGVVIGAMIGAAPVAVAQAQPGSVPRTVLTQPASAIGSVVAQATPPLAKRGAAALVVGASLESDTAAPRADLLVQRVVQRVAGALGPAAEAETRLMSLADARLAAASGTTTGSLAYVHVHIADGLLRVTLELFPVPKTIWDRARSQRPGAVAYGFGSARVDAEVRSFLTPVKLISRRPVVVPLDDPAVMALGCDDVDLDGALELVVVSRRAVSLGRVRHGSYTPIARVPWADLAPLSPHPWREPFGTVTVRDGYVFAGLTDRSASVQLDGTLATLGTFPKMAVPVAGGVGCATPRLGSFATEVEACSEELPIEPARVAFAFDASAAALHVRRDGKVRAVWSARNPTSGALHIHDDSGASHIVRSVGAQVALGDVDLDGDLDIVASKNVLDGAQDGVVLRSWRQDGTIEKRWEVATRQGVRAIATCPSEGADQSIIAVAMTNSLWLL